MDIAKLIFRNRAWSKIHSQITPAHEFLIKLREGSELDALDCSYKLKTKKFPYSLTDEEGLTIYNIISRNKLTSGFEIATAFGYSTAFIALGLKENGGVLKSVDCYIEEDAENYLYHSNDLADSVRLVRNKILAGEKPQGLQCAENILQRLGLVENVQLLIGLSPADIPELLGDDKIDFAYIDGGHYGDQPTEDFQAIRPYLKNRCAVLFHDNNNNPAVARAVEVASQCIGGGKSHRFNTRYGLTLVSRGLEPATESHCDRLCTRNQFLRTQFITLLKKAKYHVGNLIRSRGR